MMHLVIDRVEGNIAVLVMDDGSELDIRRDLLPHMAKEGDHLSVTFDNGTVSHAEIDPDATNEARQRIEDKLDKLRRGDHLLRDQNE